MNIAYTVFVPSPEDNDHDLVVAYVSGDDQFVLSLENFIWEQPPESEHERVSVAERLFEMDAFELIVIEPVGAVLSENVAVTFSLASMVIVQVVFVPEHAPDQPVKVEPEEAAAVRVTEVPEVKDVEQAEPQLMPEGLLETVPEPEPDFEMTKLTELPTCPLRTGQT